MRAVVKQGRSVQMCWVPVPEPELGEVLIRVEVAGVCSTDVYVLRVTNGPTRDLRPVCTNSAPRGVASNATATQMMEAWNGSLNRSELEVQFLEAPEQKGAVPFEPTSACRTVLGL
jgi:hypothetical protein